MTKRHREVAKLISTIAANLSMLKTLLEPDDGCGGTSTALGDEAVSSFEISTQGIYQMVTDYLIEH